MLAFTVNTDSEFIHAGIFQGDGLAAYPALRRSRQHNRNTRRVSCPRQYRVEDSLFLWLTDQLAASANLEGPLLRYERVPVAVLVNRPALSIRDAIFKGTRFAAKRTDG